MNEQAFERRARAWLELGPTEAPSSAIDAVLAAVERIPQEQPAVVALPQAPRVLRGRRPARRLVLLAAAALLLLAIGAAVYVGSQTSTPPPAPSAAPLPSGTALRTTAEMLAKYPPSTTRLEHLVGTADAPVSSSTTQTTIELGPVSLENEFFVVAGCLGPGDLTVETRVGGRRIPPDLPVACNGSETGINFPAGAGEATFAVRVAEGASWRLVVAEALAGPEPPPSFAPVATTAGWHFMNALPGVQVSPTQPTGIVAVIPQRASQIAAIVQCQGESNMDVTADGFPTATFDCRSDRAERVVYEGTGGQEITIRLVPDGLAWAEITLEANAEVASVYPEAPELPAAVAQTAYAAMAPHFLPVGTIGSNEQVLIEQREAGPGLPDGDHVAAAVADPVAREWRVDLFSISRARRLATLAAVESGFIGRTWVDAANEQVFYLVRTAEGATEYRRVGFDGSDNRLLLAFPPDEHALADSLSRDRSLFVAQACLTPDQCVRHIVDTATGGIRTVDLPPGRVCRIDAIVDSTVYETSGTCQGENGPFVTTSMPLDGGERRTIVEGAAERYLVETRAGPQLVYNEEWTPERGITFSVVEVATGESRELVSFAGDSFDSARQIAPVRLPPGWVLLAGQLTDTPGTRFGLGPVPLLYNLDTGERFEMVNLPHQDDPRLRASPAPPSP